MPDHALAGAVALPQVGLRKTLGPDSHYLIKSVRASLGAQRNCRHMPTSTTDAHHSLGPIDPAFRPEIDELRRLAMDSGVTVANLLRRAKVLGARLDDAEFITWLDVELAGYPEDGSVPPDWRRARGKLRVKNPFHGLQPIDFGPHDDLAAAVPEFIAVGHAVAEIERMAEGKGDAHSPIDNLAALFGAPVVMVIPRSQFHAILEAIRTLVLNWTIAIERRGFADPRRTAAAPAHTSSEQGMKDPRKVFIIHGRNIDAAREMQRFVSALDLAPIDFDELRGRLGGTPTVAEIVTAGMDECQAVIALFTGDERAALRHDLRSPHDAGKQLERWQARPNVIFEAGMAFGRDRAKVVFVLLGPVELFTDVEGIHVLRPTNDPAGARATLRAFLRGAGCPVSESTRWMTEGDFERVVAVPAGAPALDPFRAG